MKNGKILWMLLAAALFAGCGESTPVSTPVPTAASNPAVTAAPSDDDRLKEARDAMEAEDYGTALAALDKVSEKTDSAETLRGEISFRQAEAALDAGDIPAAMAFYRAAEKVINAESYLAVLEPLNQGDYMAAARAATENEFLYYRDWWACISARMGEARTLDELLWRNKVLSVYHRRSETYAPLNETGIESIDREETQTVNAGYVGPIIPRDPQDRLLLLSEGATELEVCGGGGGKALIVRRQQDYPRGAVYAAVDGRLGLLPPELEPCSLDEVDYIIYLDYDYAVCESVPGNDGQMLDALQMYCVVSLVNERSGEELFRSEKLMGDTDYNDPYRLEYLAGDGWLACGNPPIGEALAEAIAALPN